MAEQKALTVAQKFNSLGTALARMEPELMKTIPKHIDPKKAIRVLLTSVRKNPKLLECSVDSVMGCLMEASTLGLMLDGVTGEAYPIPYKGYCQLVAGYKGLMKLAYQSDRVLSITARVVFEKDVYEVVQGIEENIIHRPSKDPDPGEAVAFYAVAKLKGGGVKSEWMWKHEVDRIRNASPGKNSDAWVQHYEEMGKKTVIRRLCKSLPASPELQTLVSLDEMHDAGITQNLAASAGYMVEGDEDRYKGPETGSIGVGDLKAAATPSAAQEITRILSLKVVAEADYNRACELSGMDAEAIETDGMMKLLAANDYKGAVKLLVEKMTGGTE